MIYWLWTVARLILTVIIIPVVVAWALVLAEANPVVFAWAGGMVAYWVDLLLKCLRSEIIERENALHPKEELSPVQKMWRDKWKKENKR